MIVMIVVVVVHIVVVVLVELWLNITIQPGRSTY